MLTLAPLQKRGQFMRKFWSGLIGIAALLSFQSAAAQSSGELSIGQVVGNEIGQVINGWSQVGGSQYHIRKTQNYVTTETFDYVTTETLACCVMTFRRGSVFLFAQSEPIARRASGGVEAVRIINIKKFVIPTNELQTDTHCSLMWITPIMSFHNNQTKIVRSIVLSGNEFVQIRWFDPGPYCGHGD
jgi:hypothetical protein